MHRTRKPFSATPSGYGSPMDVSPVHWNSSPMVVSLAGSPMSIDTNSIRPGWNYRTGVPIRGTLPRSSPMVIDTDILRPPLQGGQLATESYPFVHKSLELPCPLLYQFLKTLRLGSVTGISAKDFLTLIPDEEKYKYGGIKSPLLIKLTQYPISCHIYTAGRARDMADVVIIQDHNHTAEVYPISVYAARHRPVITNSETLGCALQSDNPFEELRWLTPPWAAGVLQLLQFKLEARFYDREKVLYLLQKLVKFYQQLPPQFIISDIQKIGEYPVCGGGFADIWKGYRQREAGDPTSVCLKVLRAFTSRLDRDKLFKQCCDEAVIWKQLKNRNIVPFLGVNTELFRPSFCLVSPWMSGGNIIEYLSQRPQHNLNLSSVVTAIANGMWYLHSYKPQIAHGDIRGANILVDDDGVCRLADFGLAQVAETHGFKDTYTLKGSLRWLAPEMIDPSRNQDHRSSSASWRRDIYAFGCTVYEIATLEAPFAELKTDAQVMHAILGGARPPRPADNRYLNDEEIWNLIESCWAGNPDLRPDSWTILLNLSGISRVGKVVRKAEHVRFGEHINRLVQRIITRTAAAFSGQRSISGNLVEELEEWTQRYESTTHLSARNNRQMQCISLDPEINSDQVSEGHTEPPPYDLALARFPEPDKA